MFRLLPQFNTQNSHIPSRESISAEAGSVASEFLCEAVFAGGNFIDLEAVFGRVDGVITTATGYYGGTLRKPAHSEVCEGRTGHTEVVKIIYDKRRISYRSLCDVFWDTHDPTNRDFLNFGLSTHQRSAIYYRNEEERKQCQESKIRRQMKLNRRIVTKILPLNGEFYMAENQYQKYYLQKHIRVCESLSLRSTIQFAESNIARQLNGILAMDENSIIKKLTIFLLRTTELPSSTKLACQEIVENMRRN